MLRPFFQQAYAFGDGRINRALEIAMKWWIAVLEYGIAEEFLWDAPSSALVHMFVDARGSPPRCAATLFINGRCLYTDGAPSAAVMAEFEERADAQIMGLEILAISLGMATFAAELHGRRVVVWSDNTGAEAASRGGSARSWDHAVLIHDIWSLALCNHTAVWIERVATDDNLADLPSRESYKLLRGLHGEWRAPLLPDLCAGPFQLMMPKCI
jgi:hypothetical protein